MLRFTSMEQLRKAISPDVQIEDDRRPAKPVAPPSILEARFLVVWQELSGPELAREHRFHPSRRWRFDFAHLPTRIAFEIMGGLYKPQSGHRSTKGISRDYEKINEAQMLGWQVFSVTSKAMKNRDYINRLIAYVRSKDK